MLEPVTLAIGARASCCRQILEISIRWVLCVAHYPACHSATATIVNSCHEENMDVVCGKWSLRDTLEAGSTESKEMLRVRTAMRAPYERPVQ